jgi:hypothetical protein
VLKEKIESGRSIAPYFPEYNNYQMSSKGECISVLIWIVHSILWFTTVDVLIVLMLAVVVNGSDTVLHRNVKLVHFELQLLSSEVNALQLWLILIQYCVQCKLYLGCRYICSFITGLVFRNMKSGTLWNWTVQFLCILYFCMCGY